MTDDRRAQNVKHAATVEKENKHYMRATPWKWCHVPRFETRDDLTHAAVGSTMVLFRNS